MQSKNPSVIRPKKGESQEDRRFIDLLLEGRTDAEKAKILEIIHQAGIEEDDPMFLIFMVLTQCQLAIAPLPETLEQFHSDLEGFKATAYEMRAEIKRVTNSLRERALPSHYTSDNPLQLGQLVKACAVSFLAGVTVTIFLLVVLSFIKDRPLPPTSLLSTSKVFQNGLD